MVDTSVERLTATIHPDTSDPSDVVLWFDNSDFAGNVGSPIQPVTTIFDTDAQVAQEMAKRWNEYPAVAAEHDAIQSEVNLRNEQRKTWRDKCMLRAKQNAALRAQLEEAVRLLDASAKRFDLYAGGTDTGVGKNIRDFTAAYMAGAHDARKLKG